MTQKKSNKGKAPAKSAAQNESTKVVRRVKAKSTSAAKPAAQAKKIEKPITKADVKKSAKTVKAKKVNRKSRIPRPLRAIGGYFVGSWHELRQVRWPNRKSAWSLTLAVILFTLFFSGLIVLVDWIFNWLIKEVIL